MGRRGPAPDRDLTEDRLRGQAPHLSRIPMEADMPRPRRSPGAPVLIVCADAFHRGEPDYSRYGHHLVGTISIRAAPDGTPVLRWSGARAESRDTARTSDVKLSWAGIAPPLPVKQFRRQYGTRVWRLACTCGRNPEPAEAELAEIIRRHMEMKPGERVVIPLDRLERP